MWPTCITIFYWSSDLSSLTSGWCHWPGQYWLWCIDQFYILFWIRLESGTAYCLNWRYLHWFDIEIISCVVDTEHCKAHSLQVMRTQLETLGEEFKLAESIWWRGPTILWVLDLEMHWHCEDNGHIWASYLSESFVMRCFGIVRTIPTSSSSWPMDHILGSYGVHFIVPEMTLIISMRTTLFGEDFGLHCGLAITVVERLQRYNCIWLTYIDNVE